MNPSFEEAVQKFQNFLENNGYPSEVVWVTPDDVLVGSGPTVYVRSPVPPKNEILVWQLFETGIGEQRGVLFDTLCDGDRVSFCYAWMPRSVEEAEGALMPKGLKLSVRTGISRLPAQAVRSWLQWSYLWLRYWKLQRGKGGLFHD